MQAAGIHLCLQHSTWTFPPKVMSALDTLCNLQVIANDSFNNSITQIVILPASYNGLQFQTAEFRPRYQFLKQLPTAI